MKLWEKGIKTEAKIMAFTAGKDRELDHALAAFDVIASIAHVIMLGSVQLVSDEEKNSLVSELLHIYDEIESGHFRIEEDIEDIHSQVEKILTGKVGDAGKKIHTARSRNDQVLTDLKLFYREKLIQILISVESLIQQLISMSEKNKEIPLPGYTHLQAAMPSSFGLWFGAYAESLTEDIMLMKGIFHFINQNPLGSAAGYGSSFPIDREMTTSLLEFENLHVNSVNAQMTRGKTEKFLLTAISAVAFSLSRMAMDLVLFNSQNFNFISLDESITTGSSIMPHKKNPDVLELIRAKCNRLQAKEMEVQSVINNLPSGYHRDFQLLKEIVFPAIEEIKECLDMMSYVVDHLSVRKDISSASQYRYLTSVDVINEKVRQGVPFRAAYQQVAEAIKEGRFRPAGQLDYTHTGSIGNLSNDKILEKLENAMEDYRKMDPVSFRERFIRTVKNKH